jgi:hypothetical protein
MRRPSGASLTTVLVAAALLAVVGTAMTSMMSGMNRNMASLAQKGEVQEVRSMVARRLSCARTFPTGVCAAGPRGQVILLDNFNQPIFTEYDDTDPNHPTKAVFRNSYRFGNSAARVRATCGPNPAQPVLEIRVVSYLQPEKAWPTVAPILVCQEVLGTPVPCGQGTAPVSVNGEVRCMNQAQLCAAVGSVWNGTNCVLPPPVACASIGYI